MLVDDKPVEDRGIDLYMWCWYVKVTYLNFGLKCVILEVKKNKTKQQQQQKKEVWRLHASNFESAAQTHI